MQHTPLCRSNQKNRHHCKTLDCTIGSCIGVFSQPPSIKRMQTQFPPRSQLFIYSSIHSFTPIPIAVCVVTSHKGVIRASCANPSSSQGRAEKTSRGGSRRTSVTMSWRDGGTMWRLAPLLLLLALLRPAAGVSLRQVPVDTPHSHTAP